MNILFFSRLFFPHIGGVEKHVLEISKILIQRGHKVIIVAEKHNSKLKNFEIISKIEVYRIPISSQGWFKKFETWNWLVKHKGLIKDADIVHCHDVFFWYLPFRFLYLTKKVFTTFHGYEGNNLPSKKAIFMHKLAEKLSKGNICVGDYLKKWYGTKPDYVTYGGIDIKKIQNSKFKVQSYKVKLRGNNVALRSSKLKVVFVGRLELETGIMEYLKAVKILKDKGYRLHIDILGDGALIKDARDFCHSHSVDAKFHGFVKNVNKFLEETNFVFTSRYLSTLESLFAKKFVFSVYNNPIKKDCFEMSPFARFISLVKDDQDLVYKFNYYINNKDLIYNKIENGYKWVGSQTWEKMSDFYLKLWNFNEKNTNY